MKITRTMPDAGWAPISNAALRDHRLSWRARGLLCELLSHSDGYETNVDKLYAQARRTSGKTEGREALRAAMRELEEFGYVRHVRRRVGGGKVITDTYVADDPKAVLAATSGVNDEVPTPGKPSVGQPGVGSPGVGQPDVGEPGVSKNTDANTITNTDDNTANESSLRDSLRSSRSQQAASEISSETDMSETATASERNGVNVDVLYELANKLPLEDVRARLSSLELKRPTVYNACKQYAIAQIREQETPQTPREIDLLAYKYALRRYASSAKIPSWICDPSDVRRAQLRSVG